MKELPQKFCERMQNLLGEEYRSFLEEYQKPMYKGVRANTLKCSAEHLQKTLGIPLKLSPFSSASFYAPFEFKPGTSVLHHAGAFYSQEPSAASAVTLLNPKPGDKVLDLCAAPGGKSTQIAAQLQGEGLLWSNEFVRSRANILLSNIERIGVRNAVVSNCHPAKLCEQLEGFFDKVLVDAPCSGEGMFRREPKAVEDWSQPNVQMCAVRQLAILKSASKAVREGGILVYSTCTFSVEENEDVVCKFLKEEPGFVLETPEVSFGRPAFNGVQAVRIFPMDGGEGHFAAKFRRVVPNPHMPAPFKAKLPSDDDMSKAKQLIDSVFSSPISAVLGQEGNKLALLPNDMPLVCGVPVLRAGVALCEKKGKIMEPAHALFMASKPSQMRQILNLSANSAQAAAFLRGEEIECSEKGYVGVAVEGIMTGFGKASGGKLKNHYPKGLRSHR